ncbi:uncharacterized protein [Venturia canescens]|uniref:uncharacterized protein n=1 Tax=Venturia canescens TaxID=32260 RepID=UPI001C9C5D26|nr:uncharacterized protein LOC122414087 [Venturia canescens]
MGEGLLPYLEVKPDKTLTGYLGDIWTILETALKFKTDFRPTRDASEDVLKRGETDEWLAPIGVYWRNSGQMVYSHVVASNYYGLYAVSEGESVSKWWYMSIFSRELWAMSFGFVVGITGLILFMYRLKRVVNRHYEECNNQLAIPSFNLLSVLGVMTGQGFQEIPTAWSLRFTILSAVVMGMLISCGFSSTLTSYLAIRGNDLHFNSLQDILKAKTHNLCARNKSTAHDELKDMSKNGTEDWSHLINRNCRNMEDHFQYQSGLCRSGDVYVEVPDVFLSVYYPIHHKCHIVQIPGEHWPSKIAFLHARAARHRRLIDKYLLRLHSAGILVYLERKWISKEWPTSQERHLTFKTVQYEHIEIIWLAFVGMIFVSSFICVLENIWFHFESSRTKNTLVHPRVDRWNNPLWKTDFPAAQLDPTSRQLWMMNFGN